ncbi:serine/arginine repetitive matrix protein 1-like [Solenopsis invicta]|uniref:serine/arginine repetitive matrix protein 1-like n=1 Tax=Solenopsis invicta TaxID=13686 RepID=UPI00193E3FCB|nr:serine/arginine repetitive matrix protein 1-like [Solenopsis invicta]
MDSELDAILTAPANDAEFEILWQRMMHTTPDLPKLFPSPPHRRPSPTATGTPERSTRNIAPGSLEARHRSACQRSLPVLPGTSPPVPRRARPVTAIRAPPPDLVQRAKPAKRNPAPSTSRATRHPVVGVRVQRSSATNARKLAALLAEPPLIPRRAGRPNKRARQEQTRRQLTALFGDPLSDLDDDNGAITATAPQDTRRKPACFIRAPPRRRRKRPPQRRDQQSPQLSPRRPPQANPPLRHQPYRQPRRPPEYRRRHPRPRPAPARTNRLYQCGSPTT